ncbi:uncharacterized protein RJT20DRAFT_29678 [Scheffersomyces xylosifermentans]|uniref:uncharacterized protein n=1 Tax=Scheffersomyces xylosifermentans TaxID=1304137 RepID=UPI00315D7683
MAAGSTILSLRELPSAQDIAGNPPNTYQLDLPVYILGFGTYKNRSSSYAAYLTITDFSSIPGPVDIESEFERKSELQIPQDNVFVLRMNGIVMNELLRQPKAHFRLQSLLKDQNNTSISRTDLSADTIFGKAMFVLKVQNDKRFGILHKLVIVDRNYNDLARTSNKKESYTSLLYRFSALVNERTLSSVQQKLGTSILPSTLKRAGITDLVSNSSEIPKNTKSDIKRSASTLIDAVTTTSNSQQRKQQILPTTGVSPISTALQRFHPPKGQDLPNKKPKPNGTALLFQMQAPEDSQDVLFAPTQLADDSQDLSETIESTETTVGTQTQPLMNNLSNNWQSVPPPPNSLNSLSSGNSNLTSGSYDIHRQLTHAAMSLPTQTKTERVALPQVPQSQSPARAPQSTQWFERNGQQVVSSYESQPSAKPIADETTTSDSQPKVEINSPPPTQFNYLKTASPSSNEIQESELAHPVSKTFLVKKIQVESLVKTKLTRDELDKNQIYEISGFIDGVMPHKPFIVQPFLKAIKVASFKLVVSKRGFNTPLFVEFNKESEICNFLMVREVEEVRGRLKEIQLKLQDLFSHRDKSRKLRIIARSRIMFNGMVYPYWSCLSTLDELLGIGEAK